MGSSSARKKEIDEEDSRWHERSNSWNATGIVLYYTYALLWIRKRSLLAIDIVSSSFVCHLTPIKILSRESIRESSSKKGENELRGAWKVF